MQTTQNTFVLRGDIIYSETAAKLRAVPDAYVVCEAGVSRGVFANIPERFAGLPVLDRSGCLVMPGLVDLHIHAPQYQTRAAGMDLELLDWLNLVAFPEEGRYADLSYAERAYSRFAEDVRRSATTRLCVFGTIHLPATEQLMACLDRSGVAALVGLVNMDRNAPDFLREPSAEAALRKTREWIQRTLDRFPAVRPILTPRFLPSCTDELMEGLGALQREYALPVQSHLSENKSEIEWVHTLAPSAASYGAAYDRFGLFGGAANTVMAHCVHCPPDEVDLMKERGVFVAHCPQSNTNIRSGAAPVRLFLERGVPTGLGSDISGGSSLSIFRAMTDALAASKLRWRLLDDTLAALTLPEVFYMATRGGGAFFGNVGGFEDGCAFDALVVDDAPIAPLREVSLPERLERVVYLDGEWILREKFVNGAKIFSAGETIG